MAKKASTPTVKTSLVLRVIVWAATACTEHEDESTRFPVTASSVVTVIRLLGEVVAGDLIPVKLN